MFHISQFLSPSNHKCQLNILYVPKCNSWKVFKIEIYIFTDKTPAIDPGFAPRPMHFNIPLVRCYSGSTLKEFKPTIAKPMGSLEKHWAYLTLKQLLKERDAADKKEELTKKALDLALKYSFVTPVSSLVVVKPNNTESESDIQDASKGKFDVFTTYQQIHYFHSRIMVFILIVC